MPDILQMMTPSRIVFVEPMPKFELLERMIQLIATSPSIQDIDAFRKAVFDRERDLSTGIGQGLAIPHAKISQVKDFTLAMAICRKGVDFDAFDRQPIHFLIMIAANDRQASDYIKVLAKVVKVFKEEGNRDKLLQAKSAQDVHGLLQSFDL